MPLLFLFVDGVGLGEPGSENPFSHFSLPGLESVLGGPITSQLAPFVRDGVAFAHTDACLGVDGLPQSATGQTAIFTGRNASQEMGQHVSGFPLARLRKMLEADNLYLMLARRGLRCAFANAFTEEYFALRSTRRGWVSCSTRAALTAQIPLLREKDLLAGCAVYHDLTREWLQAHKGGFSAISPEAAAEDLLRLARGYDFVFHEFFLTDTAGHRQDRTLLERVLLHYDRFFSHLLQSKGTDVTLLLTSDHGNCEHAISRTHTRNPVPFLVVGSGAGNIVSQVRSLTDIAPAVISQTALWV